MNEMTKSEFKHKQKTEMVIGSAFEGHDMPVMRFWKQYIINIYAHL